MSLHRRFFLAGLLSLPLLTHRTHAQVTDPASKLIAAARAQIGITRTYDGSYQRLSYPGGDIDTATGVCSDVIIRAYRRAFSHDLQKELHQDMTANFRAYPSLWGLTRPDRNIDHRRVPNLETYFTRKAAKRSFAPDRTNLAPGDLVTMRLPGNLPHIAIVSERTRRDGTPFIIHNIGRGAEEERLESDLAETLTGRFRYLEF